MLGSLFTAILAGLVALLTFPVQVLGGILLAMLAGAAGAWAILNRR